jgi:selenium metabolism protein YedF
MMKVVNTTGLKCPAPLIKTRQALKETAEGESLHIIIDNPASLNNIKRFLKDNNLAFSEMEENGTWTIVVNRGEVLPPMENVKDYCSVEEKCNGKNVVVAITSDKMGSGNDELGEKLMNSFFKILPLVQSLPTAIVFYNAGVKFAVEGSPVEEYLKEIEASGVRLYLCTTCIDFFSLKEKIKVGIISDMYQILNVLNEADLIIRP